MNAQNSISNRLVILTTHFGSNFSGGSSATHEIFLNLQDKYAEIIVVCTQLGKHKFKDLKFRIYKYPWIAMKILNEYKDRKTTFYGDFYNSIFFVWLKIPFYFTYHDNWPEMRSFSLKYRILSLFYIPVYKSILKHARSVIAVSEYKKEYIASITKEVYLVHNGLNKKFFKPHHHIKTFKKVLMVGNVDKRKYKKALSLFGSFHSKMPFEIHIYGNVLDKRLAEKLDSFNFVKLMGFQDSIPYTAYTCFLHTSSMENLPIAICESLYYRVPVIAFDVGGIHEVVKHSNGRLIQPYDVKTMNEVLMTILERKIEFTFDNNELSDFDWAIASDSYIKIFN